MREQNMHIVDLEPQFFGQMVAAQPVLVALHRVDRCNLFQCGQNYRCRKVTSQEDRLGGSRANGIQELRRKLGDTIAYVRIGKHRKAVPTWREGDSGGWGAAQLCVFFDGVHFRIISNRRLTRAMRLMLGVRALQESVCLRPWRADQRSIPISAHCSFFRPASHFRHD